MSNFELDTICENILNMLKIREVVVDGKVNARSVKNQLNQDRHATIVGTRTKSLYRADAHVHVIVFNPRNDHVSKVPEFRKIIKEVRVAMLAIRKQSTFTNSFELIFISQYGLSKLIVKSLPEHVDELQDVIIDQYTYALFALNPTDQVYAPKHELMTRTDADAVCQKHFTLPDRFPHINETDVQVKWLGARLGDLIKVTRYTETAGVSIIYRYVSLEE